MNKENQIMKNNNFFYSLVSIFVCMLVFASGCATTPRSPTAGLPSPEAVCVPLNLSEPSEKAEYGKCVERVRKSRKAEDVVARDVREHNTTIGIAIGIGVLLLAGAITVGAIAANGGFDRKTEVELDLDAYVNRDSGQTTVTIDQ